MLEISQRLVIALQKVHASDIESHEEESGEITEHGDAWSWPWEVGGGDWAQRVGAIDAI